MRLSPADAKVVSVAKANTHDGAFKEFFRAEGDGVKVKICDVATTISKISGAKGADAHAKAKFWQEELSMYKVVVCFIHRWKVGFIEEYFDASGYYVFNGDCSDFTFYPGGDGEDYVATPRDVAMGDADERATTKGTATA